MTNGRSLTWSVMHCPAGKQFQLHAHPNLELIYCATGALHEVRMVGDPVTKEFAPADTVSTKVHGPDLTKVRRSWSFATLQAGE